MEELKKRIQEEILEELDLSVDIQDEEIFKMIDDKLDWYSKEQFLSVKDKIMLRKDVFHRLRGLDVLSQLLSKDSITEIMINGHEKIFVEEDGKIYRTNLKFESEARLENVIQQIVAKANRRVNKASPIVDTRLSDGSRVNVLLSPISLDGSILTIRKFAKEGFTMEKLVAMESIDAQVAKRLKILIESKYNIFISGGTGSGKTTFLNALSQFIPKDQRIITIEDSAELRLMQIENLVRLEVRNANIEGENEISMRDLIKSSLRMRPDRIIVGEVRDGAALDMIAAMATGHDGSLSTGHANSASDMLKRLETMVLMAVDMPVTAVRQQIASAIDIIVHLGRLRDRSRRVLEIIEILGVKDQEILTRSLYEFKETGQEDGKIKGYLEKKNELENIKKLQMAGRVAEYETQVIT